MGKILVAASSPARQVCRRILHGLECIEAGTVQEALSHLEHGIAIDLIVCTLLFDESRMLNLLTKVRRDARWKHIPFVCLRCVPSAFETQNPQLLNSAKSASHTLGATAFLDIDDYEDGEIGLRGQLEKYLVRS